MDPFSISSEFQPRCPWNKSLFDASCNDTRRQARKAAWLGRHDTGGISSAKSDVGYGGGVIVDETGSYQVAWWLSMGLAVVSSTIVKRSSRVGGP